MAIGTYLHKPTPAQCVKWDGTNAADVNTVLSAAAWSFTVELGAGVAHTPFGGSLPVDIGTWAVVSGSVQFLADADFTATYVAGTTWAVAP